MSVHPKSGGITHSHASDTVLFGGRSKVLKDISLHCFGHEVADGCDSTLVRHTRRVPSVAVIGSDQVSNTPIQ
jgi:hypothetical protein